jgi:hypothetical protein
MLNTLISLGTFFFEGTGTSTGQEIQNFYKIHRIKIIHLGAHWVSGVCRSSS